MAQAQSGLIPLGSFGSGSPIQTGGTPASQIGKGILGGIGSAFGPMGQGTTVPFAGGGNVAPLSVPANLKLAKGVTTVQGPQQAPAPNAPQPIVQAQAPTAPVSQTIAPPVGATAPITPTTPPATPPAATSTPPLTTQGANTYNAGVNALGQTLPGYIPTVGSVASNLAQTAGGSTPQYQQAVDQYNKAAQNLASIKQQEAQQISDISGMGTNLARAGGLEGNVQNLAAAQEAAQTGLMQAAAAQEAAATGQQQTQQSGLAAAGGLVSPTLGAYGQAQYLPTGGTIGGGTGAGVSPSDPFYQTLQTYAQELASGQSSAIPSSITGNPVLQAQLLQMAKQINPNFNYNQALATGASQQSQTQQAQQYQSAASQATNLGTQLSQLITQGGINPSNINAVNSFIQNIATNTSNPNYQTFQNLVNDMANTYAQVLTPAGGSTTDMVRQISGSLLNAAQSGQSILQVMQNLDAQVQAKIAGVTTAYGTTNTNTTSGSAPAGWF